MGVRRLDQQWHLSDQGAHIFSAAKLAAVRLNVTKRAAVHPAKLAAKHPAVHPAKLAAKHPAVHPAKHPAVHGANQSPLSIKHKMVLSAQYEKCCIESAGMPRNQAEE